ncbi:MAG: DUF5752 family protein [Candidatus Bathyarchaeota archaeon]
MNENNVSRILRIVPREKAFYFFSSIGNYTGISASSLLEFIEMIEQVDVKSVRFHFLRKDFEKWVEEVLEDDVLAKKIKTLRNSFLEEDVLKQRLQSTLTERYSELRESV